MTTSPMPAVVPLPFFSRPFDFARLFDLTQPTVVVVEIDTGHHSSPPLGGFAAVECKW